MVDNLQQQSIAVGYLKRDGGAGSARSTGVLRGRADAPCMGSLRAYGHGSWLCSGPVWSFLALISASATPSVASRHTHWPSSVLGIALLLLGAFVILGAVHNHRLYIRLLPPDDIPSLALPWLTSFLAISVALAGILLAIYLAIA